MVRARDRHSYCDNGLTELIIGDIPDWGFGCVDEFLDMLLHSEPPFPCTFAVIAAKQKTLRFGFIEGADDQQVSTILTKILSSYLTSYQSIGRYTSLIAFFRPDPQPLPITYYYERFWTMLQRLHDEDPDLWPVDIPKDPDEPRWEFSFGGTPMFTVCSTPAHILRKSRSSRGLVITFQPRWVFEGLEPGAPKGTEARRVIRERVRAFDSIEPHPELGFYGDANYREWKQYFLPDDNDRDTSACPFFFKRRNVLRPK